MARRFPPAVVDALRQSKIVGLRAGRRPHRLIGVWAVVVEGRVFVRSWGSKPDGWHATFAGDPQGLLTVEGRRPLRVRAVRTRSERLKDAVTEAYRRKYDTPGSLRYVRGFARSRRRDTTTELVPR